MLDDNNRDFLDQKYAFLSEFHKTRKIMNMEQFFNILKEAVDELPESQSEIEGAIQQAFLLIEEDIEREQSPLCSCPKCSKGR